MKWSWKLGQFAGISVYIHATFLLLIAWIALSHWLRGHTISAAVNGIVFIFALFGCVLFHEFGHALVAKKYGIRTRDITLLPIGGVARLERMPEDPKQELWVALAGPAVNMVIAGLIFIALYFTSGLEPINTMSVTTGSFLERLMIVNVFLVVFNLLPAFPMDGGRVLRALLARRLQFTKATQIAAGVGQGMAFLFGLIGLFSNPFLLFIALFVWIGATQEAAMAELKSVIGGIPLERAMVTEFRALSPSENLNRAIELILRTSQQDFPVIEQGHLVGILTRADLLVALSEKGANARISEVMRREYSSAESSETLESVFNRLEKDEWRVIPVMRKGELVGLLTMDNLGEFLMIQTALHKGNERQGVGPRGQGERGAGVLYAAGGKASS